MPAPNYTDSSGTLTQVVGRRASSTVLASDVNPSGFGQPVTFTATVTAGGAPVTGGTVTFTDAGTSIGGPVPVAADGTAVFSTSSLAVGSHPIVRGLCRRPELHRQLRHVYTRRSRRRSSTVLTSDVNPSGFGQPVTFTATVTAGGAPVTGGTVTFTDAGTSMGGSVPVAADGTAVFSTSSLAVGSHPIAADYAGAPNYTDSSGTLTQEVEPLVAVAGGPYTVAEGGSLTLDGSGSTADAEYGWDLNGDNDFTDATGLSPTLSWADLEAIGIDDGPFSRVIELRVTVLGLEATGSANLAVTNTTPAAVITGALTATVDQPFTVKVGADDPSSADTAAQFTYTADWGDGSPVETITGPADPPLTHTYAAAGDFDASFTATDKDGGVSTPTVVQVEVQSTTTTTTTTPAATGAPPTATTPAAALTTTSKTGTGFLPATGVDVGSRIAVGAAFVLAGLVLSCSRSPATAGPPGSSGTPRRQIPFRPGRGTCVRTRTRPTDRPHLNFDMDTVADRAVPAASRAPSGAVRPGRTLRRSGRRRHHPHTRRAAPISLDRHGFALASPIILGRLRSHVPCGARPGAGAARAIVTNR